MKPYDNNFFYYLLDWSKLIAFKKSWKNQTETYNLGWSDKDLSLILVI